MDLLIHAAGVYRDKNLFWVSHSPRPDAISPKVRDFLATSRNGGLLPGQDADRFFLDLCKELEIGAPRAIAQPLSTVTRVIADVSLSTVTDTDIRSEITAAQARLGRLQAFDAKAELENPTEAIISAIREARLAGDPATAYRLANEALSE
jgi:hypothetical protein